MLNRIDIERAFARMGEILWQQRRCGEIAIFGGSAIILQFNLRPATADVDALIEREHGAVLQAQFQVADELGWHRGWLNEQVAPYLSETRDVDLYRTYPSEDRPGLRVYLARPEYLLAMKMMSLRAGTSDLSDVVAIAKVLEIKTTDDLASVLRQYYPHREVDARLSSSLQDIVERIHATPE